MTNPEPTPEREQLSGPVRRLIDAYRMGAVLEAKDLYAKKPVPTLPLPTPSVRPV